MEKDKTELKDTANKYKITKVKEAEDIYIFILEILNATSTDTGVYKVLAKNDAGDSQALVNLTVEADASPPQEEEEKKPQPVQTTTTTDNKLTAPVFTGKPKEVTGTDGDKVQIECKVTGSPAPEITWLFKKKK
jgi:hypothetical protein